MATELMEPVVADGVRLTHFFNGRTLTAEDLKREQDAARDRHRGLAGTVGEGVVRGFEVSITRRSLPAPAVRITAGLAFNRDGDPVALPRDVELRLIPGAEENEGDAGVFSLCDAVAAQAEITNPGFYVLAARPASALSREQVAAVDLASEGVGTRCGSRYAELGAAFTLVPLPIPAGGPGQPLAQVLTELAASVATDVETYRRGGAAAEAVALPLARSLSKLRNGVAYWCAGFGAPGERISALAVPVPGFVADPLSPLESLRTGGALASCEVPVALLYVTRRQLEWVDAWAVRRTPSPRLGPEPAALVEGSRSRARTTAMVMQFRDHAATFLAADTPYPPAGVAAPEWFLFLPPVGVLPLTSESRNGFVPSSFFPWLGDGWIPAISQEWGELLIRRGADEAPWRTDDYERHPNLYRFNDFPGDEPGFGERYVMFSSRTDPDEPPNW